MIKEWNRKSISIKNKHFQFLEEMGYSPSKYFQAKIETDEEYKQWKTRKADINA